MRRGLLCYGEKVMEDTIAAVATAYGEGGIGIVRVSGEKAEERFRNAQYRLRQDCLLRRYWNSFQKRLWNSIRKYRFV